MAIADFIRLSYLSYFSQPSTERLIYRIICRCRVRGILELGVTDGRRAARMIEVARRAGGDGEIHYTGVDLFEARTASDGPGVPLKLAHRMLSATGARVRLLPGDPYSALAHGANTLAPVDLVVVSAQQDAESLARAWFFVPRILHPESTIFVQRRLPEGRTAMDVLSPADVRNLAAAATTRRKAA